jgi:pilus assembly protein CpaB
LEAIIQPGDRSVVSAVIAPGMRAFSIPIQIESASAGFITPGDRVDILLAANFRSALGGSDKDAGASKANAAIINWATETVLYNAKVLAIDQQLSHDAKDGPSINGKILTLEVTPRDAEKLFAAQQLGSFSITLRSMMSDRSDSAKLRDTDNPSFHPFTSDKEASRALSALTQPGDSVPAPGSTHASGTVVRVNRGGLISEQSF